MTAGKLSGDVPGSGCTAVTVGATRYSPGRSFKIDCTGAGTATLVFLDGSTMTLNLQANTIYDFPWAIVGVSAAAATATYHIIY